MMTMREHLEAIRNGMADLALEATYRANREAYNHALSALAILDAFERVDPGFRCWEADETGSHVVIPDPKERA